MSDLKRVSGIDINQDMDFQWREWRFHQIAWVFFAAILLAGLLGLLGQGPLSSGRVGETGGALALEYERIDRLGAPTGMRVMLGPRVAEGGSARVAFSRNFMDRISVEEIVPEPAEVATSAEQVVYTFEIEDTAQPTSIRLDFEHEQAGTARGVVRLEGGPELAFSAFVWP
jgi:hypothetical protein